jgi:glycosyltransferase involved in cell wall biosynthesis
MISILLPNYNNADYLPACLESVIAQSESGWELIAVDDYSTDHSWSILRQYACSDDRVRCFRNKGNKGVIGALQTAFSHSKYPLVTRMDADDLMPSSKLQLLKDLWLKKGRGWVTTGKVKYFSAEGLGNGYKRYEAWLNSLMDKENHYQQIYKECPLPSPAWMAHKADLEACGAFESEVYPEDYDLCFRMYKHGLKIAATPELVHLWRDHAQRSTRTTLTYIDHTFLELKMTYFMSVDYKPERPLVVWGAGKKGKRAAKHLLSEGVPFSWVCNTPEKIGKDIYGVRMNAAEKLDMSSKPFVLVMVAAVEGQTAIARQLTAWGLAAQQDYFFFC